MSNNKFHFKFKKRTSKNVGFVFPFPFQKEITVTTVESRFSDWAHGWMGSRRSGPITMNL